MAKKKKKRNQLVYCSQCRGICHLVPAIEYFKERTLPVLKNEYIYLCSNCGAYISCHQGTTKPKGYIVGDAKLRHTRIVAHKKMDELVATGISKEDVYSYLGDKFGRPYGRFHFSDCAEYTCNVAIQIMEDLIQLRKNIG